MNLARLFACTLALVAFSPALALAQKPAPSSADARGRARKLADKGYELYQAGKYADALSVFRKAEAEFHAPTLLLMIARCYERVGRLLEARSIYETVVEERLPPGAPAAFAEAQRDAKSELQALIPSIPTLQVTVAGAPDDEVSMTLDGAPIAAGGPPIPRNPGRAVVIAGVQGQPPVEHVLEFERGRSERLTLQLGASARGSGSAEDSSAGGSYWLPGIAFGVAGLGLTAGVVTGIIAKGKIDDIESRCDAEGNCLISDEPQARSAERLAGVSTVAFVAGGVAVAAGVTLLLLRPSGGASSSGQQAGLKLMLGPGSARIVGRF